MPNHAYIILYISFSSTNFLHMIRDQRDIPLLGHFMIRYLDNSTNAPCPLHVYTHYFVAHIMEQL